MWESITIVPTVSGELLAWAHAPTTLIKGQYYLSVIASLIAAPVTFVLNHRVIAVVMQPLIAEPNAGKFIGGSRPPGMAETYSHGWEHSDP
jgi:hypothetical protein